MNHKIIQVEKRHVFFFISMYLAWPFIKSCNRPSYRIYKHCMARGKPSCPRKDLVGKTSVIMVQYVCVCKKYIFIPFSGTQNTLNDFFFYIYTKIHLSISYSEEPTRNTHSTKKKTTHIGTYITVYMCHGIIPSLLLLNLLTYNVRFGVVLSNGSAAG